MQVVGPKQSKQAERAVRAAYFCFCFVSPFWHPCFIEVDASQTNICWAFYFSRCGCLFTDLYLSQLYVSEWLSITNVVLVQTPPFLRIIFVERCLARYRSQLHPWYGTLYTYLGRHIAQSSCHIAQGGQGKYSHVSLSLKVSLSNVTNVNDPLRPIFIE